MAEASSKALFTGDQVLDLLDSDTEEDFDDWMDKVFFPGSDDELGFVEDEIENAGRLVKIICARTIIITIPLLMFSDDEESGDEYGEDSSSGYGII